MPSAIFTQNVHFNYPAFSLQYLLSVACLVMLLLRPHRSKALNAIEQVSLLLNISLAVPVVPVGAVVAGPDARASDCRYQSEALIELRLGGTEWRLPPHSRSDCWRPLISYTYTQSEDCLKLHGLPGPYH
jgi:hypothetical protein